MLKTSKKRLTQSGGEMANLPLSKKERMKRWRERLKERAFNSIGWKCIFCKTSDRIQAAHVIPTEIRGPSRGKDIRYLDIIRNPHCYRPMCTTCHRAYDKLSKELAPAHDDEPIPF